MPLQPKPIPLPQANQLIPPDPARNYFDFAIEVPFDSRQSDFSLANAVWLAEASFAAYLDEQRHANLDHLMQLKWNVNSLVEENARCLVLDGPEAMVLAF